MIMQIASKSVMIYCNCKSNSVHFYFYFILTRESLCGNLDENLCQKDYVKKYVKTYVFLCFKYLNFYSIHSLCLKLLTGLKSFLAVPSLAVSSPSFPQYFNPHVAPELHNIFIS